MKNLIKKHKTVLVTGATSGIGYEISKIFAKNGYDLILVARRIDKLEKLSKEISQKFGVSSMIIQKDLSYVDSAKEVFRDVENQNISVDVLINNAGSGNSGLFHEIEYEKHIDTINLNIMSLTLLTRLFANKMIHKGEGKILNVASTGAYQPGPYTAVYYATKAYVLSFSEAITNELKDYGINVTTLCPGATKTEFSKRAGKVDINGAMTAEAVARSAYYGLLKNKRIVIPGFQNKVAIVISKILPGNILSYFVRKIQKKVWEKNKC